MEVDGIPNCKSFGVPSCVINDETSMLQSLIEVQVTNEYEVSRLEITFFNINLLLF